MKALTWPGKKGNRCDTVPHQIVEHLRGAIIKITTCAISALGLSIRRLIGGG
jgi:hypothetical protein